MEAETNNINNNLNNNNIMDDETNNDFVDEAPTFIDMNSAVEVNVDDTNIDLDDEMMDDDNAKLGDQQSASSSTPSRQIVDQSKATFKTHTDAIYAISSHYNPTTHTLSILSGGGDDRANLHTISTSSTGIQNTNTIPLTHPHTDSISCVAFNTPFITNDVSGIKQVNLMAVGSYDGSIILYNGDGNESTNATAVGQLIHVLEGPSDVEFLTFHPKGGTVLLAGSIADGTIWMYHTPTKTCLQVFVGHDKGGVTSGAFTPDGKSVVSVGQDGTCRVWAPKKGVCKHVFRLMDSSSGGGGGEDGGPGAGLTCLAVGGGTDGQLALCGGEDGNAYVVHISGKKLVATLPHFDDTPNASNTTNGGGMNEDDEDIEEGEARSIEAVGFCSANIPGTAHWCATGGVDGILKIWNMNVATGGSSAQLRQRCVRPDYNPEEQGGVMAITKLAWHTSQPLVICSYTDGVICVWDVRVGTLVSSLTGHEDMINDMCVNFVGGDNNPVAVIVTGSDDKMVKMFEFHA